jgi:hypothetical protein
MIGLFRRSPPAVRKLYDDSIAALLQALAASANKPELDAKILKAARANLTSAPAQADRCRHPPHQRCLSRLWLARGCN